MAGWAAASGALRLSGEADLPHRPAVHSAFPFRMMKRILSLAVLLAAALMASGAGARPVSVVASFSILGDIVEQVGGEHVRVRALVGPDQDAHIFQPRPSDASAVAQADLVVLNGLGFEGWMTRLMQASAYRGPVHIASEGVVTRALERPQLLGRRAQGHTHAHAGDHEALDPHAWQDPLNVVRYAQNIAQALAEVDEAHADVYRRNAEAYGAKLRELDAWVGAQLRAVAPERRKVITAHEAMGYFGSRYGVMFLAPQGMTTASEPAAREVARLIRQIREEGVTALFLEGATNPALLQQIAAESGVKLGGRLYSDALSTADGPAPDYISLIRYNVEQLRAAMLQP